jgi:ribosomal protein S18 acetylase RimI-like enzyme
MNPQGRARAIDFLCAIEDACAERVVPCPGGHAILDSRHPRLWGANRLRLETAVAPDADLLAAAAEEHLAGLDFRMIAALDEAVGGALAEALVARGYEPAHELLMIFGRQAPGAGAGPAITEIACEQLAGSRGAAAIERLGDAAVGDQLASRDALIASVIAVRCFAVLVGGTIAARCQLYADGAVAQVENVYTASEHRRRGFARALVTHAVAEAHAGGAQLVFLVADANDWPQRLYCDIGFRDAGLLHRFKRLPPPPPPTRSRHP